MSRISVRDELQPVVQRAVELSRVSGAGQREYSGSSSAPTHEDTATQTDVDGNTLHDFILGLDVLDDLNSLLA